MNQVIEYKVKELSRCKENLNSSINVLANYLEKFSDDSLALGSIKTLVCELIRKFSLSTSQIDLFIMLARDSVQ